MGDEVVYMHFVGYLKAKIADAELNKEDSFELTKVGNEDGYEFLCGRLEAFIEALNEIEDYYM